MENDPQHRNKASRIYGWRDWALVSGYLIFLGASLSILLIPLSITSLSLVGGTILVFLSPPSPPMARRSAWVYFAGVAAMIGIFCFFGGQRVSHWTPRPTGWISAWITCFHGFRHIWHGLFSAKYYEPDTAQSA
jgi:hypothetical protein